MSRRMCYISARFAQQPEMRTIAKRITAMGHAVCSGWLSQRTTEPQTRAAKRRIARRDVTDVLRADLVIADFSIEARGGREVEWGIAIAKHIECWSVANTANQGNVFTALSREFDSWDDALAALAAQTGRAA